VFSNKFLTEKENKKHAELVDNIDTLVDDVLAKNKGSFSSSKVEKKYFPDEFFRRRIRKKPFSRIKNRMPVRKILAVVLTFILIFVVIPASLPYLYGSFDSGVAISLYPENVHNGDSMFVNATISSSYNIHSVTADIGGIETLDLSLIDNSTDQQIWQVVWLAHDVEAGEHTVKISALDQDNKSYGAEIRWSVLAKETIDLNETSEPSSNETRNVTSNETEVLEPLNISISADKESYFVNDTVNIQGAVKYNETLVATAVNITIKYSNETISSRLDATNGSFYYQFIPIVDGYYNVDSSAIYGNDTAYSELNISVLEKPDISTNETAKPSEEKPGEYNDVEPYVFVPLGFFGDGHKVINESFYRNWLNNTIKWTLFKSADKVHWVDCSNLLIVDKVWNPKNDSEKHTLSWVADTEDYYELRLQTKHTRGVKSYTDLSKNKDEVKDRVNLGFDITDTEDYEIFFDWSDYKSSAEASKTSMSKELTNISNKQQLSWSVCTDQKLAVGEKFVIDPTYGLIGSTTNSTWEYDGEEGRYPDAIKVGSDGTYSYFAIVSTGNTGTENDGYVRTIKVLESTGAITSSLVDYLEYDTSDGYNPSICHVSGDYYAISYCDGTMPTIVTVSISSTGVIPAAVTDTQQLTSLSQAASHCKLLHITGNVYAVVYEGSALDAAGIFLETVEIATDGTITNPVLDTVQISTGTSDVHPDMCLVDSDTVAVTFNTGMDASNSDIMHTWNISAAGDIAATYADSWTVGNGYGATTTIAKVSGTTYMVAYITGLNDLYVSTCTIADTGDITSSWIDSQAIDTTYGAYPTFFNVSTNGTNKWIKGISFSGEGSDGYVSTFDVTSAGIITSEIDTLEVSAADTIGWYQPVCWVRGNFYLLITEVSDYDGWAKTFTIETNTNVAPTAAYLSGADAVHYAGKEYSFTTRHDDADGVSTIQYAYAAVGDANNDIQFRCDPNEGTSPTVTVVSGSSYLVGGTATASRSGTTEYDITWTYTIDWDWDHDDSAVIDYFANTTDDNSTYSGWDTEDLNYDYENELIVKAVPSYTLSDVAYSEDGNTALTEGEWFRGGVGVTAAGVVCYEGATSEYPPTTAADVQLYANGADLGEDYDDDTLGSSGEFSIPTYTTPSTADIDSDYDFDVTITGQTEGSGGADSDINSARDNQNSTGTITAIANGIDPDEIAGTASDGSGSGVEADAITIFDDTDNTYWDGDSWDAGATWLSCTGTTTWSYGASGVSWNAGHNIIITLNITDDVGNVNASADTEDFTTNYKPSINFTEPPTPANNTETENTWANVSVSVSDADGDNISSFIDWYRSLRGYWSMDHLNSTGVYDNSTYDNFANYTGADFGSGNQTTGIYGDALEFDGADDYLNVNDHSSLDITDEITIEAWVKDPPLIPSGPPPAYKNKKPEITNNTDKPDNNVNETSDTNKQEYPSKNILSYLKFKNMLNEYILHSPTNKSSLEKNESIKNDESVVNILNSKTKSYNWYNTNFLKNFINKFNPKKIKDNETINVAEGGLTNYTYLKEPDENSTGRWVRAVIIPPYIDSNISEIREMMNSSQEKVVLVDVRTNGEYSISHIDGAISLPLYDMHTNESINEKLARYKDYKIIVYCDNGSRSERAAVLLYLVGFKNIYNMLGGLTAWKEAGYPVWEASATDEVLINDFNNSLEPIIVSAYVEPTDVWPGDTMLVSLEIKDNYGISSVTADMGGIETIELELTKGSIYRGIWQSKWLVHDTLRQNYTTNITVTNILGRQALISVNWSDDEYVRPTDSYPNAWLNEGSAYDASTSTYASYEVATDYGWTTVALYLMPIDYGEPAQTYIDCDKIKYSFIDDDPDFQAMNIIVFNNNVEKWDSEEVTSWTGGIGTYDTESFGSTITVDEIGIWFKLKSGLFYGAHPAKVYDVYLHWTSPSCTTNAATLVEEASATFNGVVDDASAEAGCTAYFHYGYSEASMLSTTTPQTKTDGQSCAVSQSGLTSGDLVYYRLRAVSNGGSGFGSVKTFFTKPEDPDSISCTSQTSSSLTFSVDKADMGSGATSYTYARYSTSTYPTTTSSGSEGFNSESTTPQITGLSAGTKYYISAWAYGTEGGKGQYSDTYITELDYTLPGEPSGLNAQNPTNSSIYLTWSRGSGGDKTMIRYKTSGYPSSESDGTQAYFDIGLSTTVSGLDPGQIYYFRAWAYDSDSGYYSSGYSSDSDYTKPLDASGLDAKNPTANTINLSWTKGTGGDKTMIRRSTTSPPTLPTSGDQAYFGTGNSTTVSGLNSNQIYYFSAWAYDSDSTYYSVGYCSDSETTLLVAPNVTTNAATNIEETTATLNAEITATGGENPNRYIEWGTYGSSFTHNESCGSGGVGAYSKAITGLANGTRYQFRGLAGNSVGWSNGTNLTFRTKPQPPSSFGATAINKTQINLGWTNGNGYWHTVIIRKNDSAPTSRTDYDEIVYNGTGTSGSDSNLDGFRTYYYQAWSMTDPAESDLQYSDSPDQTASAATWSPKTIIAKGDAYQLVINGTTLYGYLNGKLVVSTSIDENWHHVALTYDGSTANLYVDGNLNDTNSSFNEAIKTNDNNIHIGNDLTGELDEVRLWSRALSWEEINASYNASSSYYHNFTGLASNNYSYYAHAIDETGNENTTETRYFNMTAGGAKAPTNGAPTLNNFDDTNNCYAKKKWYNITVVYTDENGYSDFNYVELWLNQSSTNRAIFRYTEATNTFSQIDALSKFDFNTSDSVAIKTGNNITVHWHFMPDWDADEESDVDIQCYCIDDGGLSDNDTTNDQFDVITNILPSSIECVAPNDDDNPDRVSVSELLTVNFTVRYADDPGSNTASSSYPPNDEFTSVSVRNSAGANQSTNSSIADGNGSCSFTAPSLVGSDNYTLWIRMEDADYTDGEEATPKEWIITDRIDVTNIVVTDYIYYDGSRYWDINSPITITYTAKFDYDEVNFDGNLTVGYSGNSTAWGNTTISGGNHIATPNDYQADEVITRDDVTVGAVVNGSYNITSITVSATKPEVGWDGKSPTCNIEYNDSSTYFTAGDKIIIYVNFSTGGGTGINESTAKITISTQGDGDLAQTLLNKTDNTHWSWNWTIPDGSDEDGNFTVSITAENNLSTALSPDPTNDTTKYIDNTAPTFSAWEQDQDTDSGGDGYDPRTPSAGTGYEDDDNCTGDFSGCTDSVSGIAYYYIERNGGSYGPGNDNGLDLNCTLTPGWNYIYYKIVDNVGNEVTGNTTDRVYYGTTNPSNFDMDITESSEYIYIADATDIVSGNLYYDSAQNGNFSIAVDGDGSADWGSGGAWKVKFAAGFDQSEREDTSSPYTSNNYEINGASTTSLTVTIINNCSWLLNLTLNTIYNSAPTLSGETPSNANTSVLISTSTINVTISDLEGDGLNWTIETSPDIGSQDNSSGSEGNGSKNCSVSGLSSGTMYYWYVNASDGMFWTNATYNFTTEEANISIVVSPNAWNQGNVSIGSSNVTTGYYFNLTNEGNVPINVQIKADNATNATTGARWNLTSSAGNNNFNLSYQKSGTGSWNLINCTYDAFITSLLVAGYKTFDLKMYMAATSTTGDPMAFDITLKSVIA